VAEAAHKSELGGKRGGRRQKGKNTVGQAFHARKKKKEKGKDSGFRVVRSGNLKLQKNIGCGKAEVRGFDMSTVLSGPKKKGGFIALKVIVLLRWDTTDGKKRGSQMGRGGGGGGRGGKRFALRSIAT